ncbi:MAG: hypothetical protein GY774_28690 [Planctomycetes bacterium]|nr:hypothetical protein [Planctomycetota bacterium]
MQKSDFQMKTESKSAVYIKLNEYIPEAISEKIIASMACVVLPSIMKYDNSKSACVFVLYGL